MVVVVVGTTGSRKESGSGSGSGSDCRVYEGRSECQLAVTCAVCSSVRLTDTCSALLCSTPAPSPHCAGVTVQVPPQSSTQDTASVSHNSLHHTHSVQCKVTRRHHGHPHQCRPRGLHPHGENQHGGVCEEPENKVRPAGFVF